MRARAARALGELGVLSSIPILSQIIEQEKDEAVILEIISAMTVIIKPELRASMSETPKFDLRGANIGNLASTVQGNQVYNAAPQPEMATALNEIKQLLEALQQKHSTTDETILAELIEDELDTLQQEDPNR